MEISKMTVRIFLSVTVLLVYNGQAPAQDNIKYERLSSNVGTLDIFNSPDFDTDIDSGFIKAYTAEQLITPDSLYYRRVDAYFQQEGKIASLIVSLFRNEYSDLNLKNSGSEGRGIQIYSESLSKIVDGYFDYIPSGRKTIHLDTIYRGCLIKDKIATHKQKMSFLMGAFLRNGTVTDSKEYVISLPNSAGKAEVCAEILKELGCKNIIYSIYKDYIPVGHKITFEPSEEVRKRIQMTQRLPYLDETSQESKNDEYLFYLF